MCLRLLHIALRGQLGRSPCLNPWKEHWNITSQGKIISTKIEVIPFLVLCKFSTHFWLDFSLFIGRSWKCRPLSDHQVDNFPEVFIVWISLHQNSLHDCEDLYVFVTYLFTRKWRIMDTTEQFHDQTRNRTRTTIKQTCNSSQILFDLIN